MDVIWSATIATTVATGMRKPRMHGMPPITSGSMVTRVTRMSIRLAGDSTLGRFSTSRLGLSSAKSKPEGDFAPPAARFRAVTLAWLRWLRVSTMASPSPVPPVVRAVSVVSARAERIAASSSGLLRGRRRASSSSVVRRLRGCEVRGPHR